jgi:chorismate mutase
MRKDLQWLLLLVLPTVATAQMQPNLSPTSNLSQGYDALSTQCQDLQCIADNLDLIDQQIGALIAKRLAYVKRGAYLKNTNVLAPKAAGEGYGNTVQQATSQATGMGASKGAVGSVFESIQKQSNEYEKKYLKPVKQPDSSQFSQPSQPSQPSQAPESNAPNQ